MKKPAVRILIAFMAVLMLAGACAAQSNDAPAATPKPEVKTNPQPPLQPTRNSYRLDFTLTELDGGKKVNSRNYAVICQDLDGRTSGMLRVGSRVPVPVNLSPGGATPNQFQYMDVGVNIDATIEQTADGLTMYATADVSSLAENPNDPRTSTSVPVVRQMKFRSYTSFTPGKPLVLSTADDVASNRRFEVTVVATKLAK
jgi:hypothetical protein